MKLEITRWQLEARYWYDEAVRLDAENRELRGWLTSLIWWIAERRELCDLARAQIERRWPNGTP